MGKEQRKNKELQMKPTGKIISFYKVLDSQILKSM